MITSEKAKAYLLSDKVIVVNEIANVISERGFGSKLFQPLPASVKVRMDTDPNDQVLSSIVIPPKAHKSKQTPKSLSSHDMPKINSATIEFDEASDSIVKATNCDITSDNLIRSPCEDSESVDITPKGPIRSLNKAKSLLFSEIKSKENILVLRDEEAYYLLLNGAIIVHFHNSTTEVTLNNLWEIFVRRNSKFPLYYKTYAHFKELGYCVKGGMNYGVDFVLYRTTPLWCHSEFCCTVIDATNDDFIKPSENLSWKHLSSQTRITQDVMKTLIFCYVTKNDKEFSADSATVSSTPIDLVEDLNMNIKSESCSINYSNSSCLQVLCMRPVAVTNRRRSALNENYSTVGELQIKFGNLAILKRPRKQVVSKIMASKRQLKPVIDVNDRPKKKSKHAKVWMSLKKKENK